MTQRSVQAFVLDLRERGVSPVTCNNRGRALNAFLKWMHSEGHTATALKIPLQRTEQQIIKTLSETQLRTLIDFRPRTRCSSTFALPISALATSSVGQKLGADLI